ncbi:protein of unknown function [Magnetospirillum sp. XM-1]|nr:protein of unknown function [Magnetospirillum sp. XM-1]
MVKIYTGRALATDRFVHVAQRGSPPDCLSSSAPAWVPGTRPAKIRPMIQSELRLRHPGHSRHLIVVKAPALLPAQALSACPVAPRHGRPHD